MPRIFDNIEQQLLPALTATLEKSDRADFCVGYFNLRGWKQLDSHIERWSGGEGHCCRLLIGMQRLPQDELHEVIGLLKTDGQLDNATAIKLKKKLAEEFRNQLAIGVPTNADEAGLRRLSAQIKSNKVIVKLFLKHTLHAKLYLLFRPDNDNPRTGYLGSSNLTLSGLKNQGELNVDVVDHDATQKLADWFNGRWNDKWCVDISAELSDIIDQSWAREDLIPPYHIYLKIAYHLSQEARAGLAEFRIPKDFGNKLFAFQTAAVKIAAHHLNKRNGVIIGDVVGLGKTLMATALARIFEDDQNLETLIICPKNLVPMWEDYRDQYRLRARVLSISKVIKELPNLRRFRLVLIDESHNLRNREGKRYRAIQEYIFSNESKVILLSATPYNKTYLDLSSQLRLFIEDHKDLGIRPERLLKEMTETEFIRRHQSSVRSLAAFEKSIYSDDWRELMRLYLVRRTRTFIQDNYAKPDETGKKYLLMEDGKRSYFPERVPKTLKFKIEETNRNDQYARLYSQDVVDVINHLKVPRYGLGNYVPATPHREPTPAEAKILQDLSRAGRRLMGFSRVNLFKRLESSGQAFILSVERHILRNFIYLYAIEAGKQLPIGTQEAELLDSRLFDEDADDTSVTGSLFEDDESESGEAGELAMTKEGEFRRKAEEIYRGYSTQYKTRFKWLTPDLFVKSLQKDLHDDSLALMGVLKKSGDWQPSADEKLKVLRELISKAHPAEKVLIFSQFADTVRYLTRELTKIGLKELSGVTGSSEDPTSFAWRFSPVSNDKQAQVPREKELRVLLATDVLSEGQNLQDSHVVVNYDLPWAIIRLIQRAGRVDRIGQEAEKILCYSFLPAEGVERIIRLRARVRQRLQENAEVVGADESFFEDDRNDEVVVDLYNEKSGLLDGDIDSEVDLASYAYQIWRNAIEKDETLEKAIPELPSVVFTAKEHQPTPEHPAGALVYMKTAEGNDALAWVDQNGKNVTESRFEILKAAECKPETPAVRRSENHHELVARAAEYIVEEEKSVGGQLGRPSGARFRTYERLKQYAQEIEGEVFDTLNLKKAIEDIYRFPLRQAAVDTLNRQLKTGISDQSLADLVVTLREEGRLCLVSEEERTQEPQIICSMGLKPVK